MKNQKNNIKIQGLLDKYKLSEPIPEDVQKHFSSKMGPIFRNVLKAAGISSLFFGAFAYIFFLLKKFGLILTAKFFIIVTVTATLTGSTVIAYKYIEWKEEQREELTEEQRERITEGRRTKAADSIKDPKKAVIVKTIGIRPFISSNVDRRILQSAANGIRRELQNIRGYNFATIIWGSEKGLKYRMTGKIDKYDEIMILSVKVVNLKKSSIIFTSRDSFTSQDQLNDLCKQLAIKLSKKLQKNSADIHLNSTFY